MPFKGRKTTLLAAAVAAVCAAGTARAQLTYTAEGGLGYTDNLERNFTDEVSATMATLGLELEWVEDRSRLDANVNMDLDFYHYLDGEADSEVRGNADALLVFGIVQDHFTWRVQDSFGQAEQDPLGPETPSSLENTNYFTTGPDFILQLGSVATMRALGRYSWSTYEDTPIDNQRATYGIILSRQTSERSTFGLNALHDEVEFDDPSNVDFERRTASLTYALDAARTDIDVELGQAWVQRAVPGEEEQTGPIATLRIARTISNSQTLTVSAGTQLTDTSEALRSALSGEGGGGRDVTAVTASSDTFENRSAGIGWEFRRRRTSFGLNADWDRDEYDTQSQLDRERKTFGARAERHLNSRISLSLQISVMSEELLGNGETADELGATIGMSWRMGRDFGLNASYERRNRDSSASTEDAVENRVFVTLFYQPAGSAR